MSETATPIVRGLYDRNTAAEYLSCSPQLIDKLIRDGHLKATVPFGMTRGRRVTHEELERYRLGLPTDDAPLAAVTELRAVG